MNLLSLLPVLSHHVVAFIVSGTLLMGAVVSAIVLRCLRQKERKRAMNECVAKLVVVRATMRTGDANQIRAIGGMLIGVRSVMQKHGLTNAEVGLKNAGLSGLAAQVRALTEEHGARTIGQVARLQHKNGARGGNVRDRKKHPNAAVRTQKELLAEIERLRRDRGGCIHPAPTRLGESERRDERARPGLLPGTMLGGPVQSRTNIEFPARSGDADIASAPATPTSVTQPSMVPPPGSDRWETPGAADIPVSSTEPCDDDEATRIMHVLPEIGEQEFDVPFDSAQDLEQHAAPDSFEIVAELSDSFFTDPVDERDPETLRSSDSDVRSSGVRSAMHGDHGDEEETVCIELDPDCDRISDYGPYPAPGARTSITGEFNISGTEGAASGPGLPQSGKTDTGLSQEIEAMFKENFGERFAAARS